MFAKYKTCCFCNSNKLKKDKIQKFKYNFYIEAIMSHFNLRKNKISLMKVYTCNICNLKQNSPWFYISQTFYLLNFRIYNVVDFFYSIGLI